MELKKTFVMAAAAAMLATASAQAEAPKAKPKKDEKEKCYGIAKAGKNDTEALDQIIAICHWYNSRETIESLLQKVTSVYRFLLHQ